MNEKQLIQHVGNTRGHFTSKANRAAKLIAMWPTLEEKMVSIIEAGHGETYHSMCAYAVLLMMETGIRVGNEASAEGWVCENRRVAAKDNRAKGVKKGDVIWQHPCYGQLVKTYGLTTLLHSHVRTRKMGRRSLKLSFIGKKIEKQELETFHPTLVEFRPVGKPDTLFLGVTYNDLKQFVRRYVGRGYTCKDIRMAKVNLIFVKLFASDPYKSAFKAATSKAARKRSVSAAIEKTAEKIGHTKGVCKSAYLSAPLVSHLIG